MNQNQIDLLVLKMRAEDTNVMWDAFVLEQKVVQESPELTEQAIKASEEMYKLIKLIDTNGTTQI
jgi:hypothetical protein